MAERLRRAKSSHSSGREQARRALLRQHGLDAGVGLAGARAGQPVAVGAAVGRQLLDPGQLQVDLAAWRPATACAER